MFRGKKGRNQPIIISQPPKPAGLILTATLSI